MGRFRGLVANNVDARLLRMFRNLAVEYASTPYEYGAPQKMGDDAPEPVEVSTYRPH